MRKKGRRFLRILLIVIIALFIVYLLGPSPSTPVYSKEMPSVPAEPAVLQAYIRGNEAQHKLKSAKEALAIGRQLGNKVILMGTSTGGTFALQLAATYPDQVAALVLLSPNIAINDPNAWLLNNHWGLQIAHLVTGGNYIEEKRDF